MRRWGIVLLCAAVCFSAAQAQQAIQTIKPDPAAPPWVVAAPAPTPAPAATGLGAARLLLVDYQIHLSPEGDSTYTEFYTQVRTPQGLMTLGTLGMAWNPDTDKAVVHKLHIIRGGQVIDLLAKQNFTVLRRENNLEMAVIDGVLTASIQPEGLQVGDIVNFATTITQRDPVLQGHSNIILPGLRRADADRVRVRVTWDKSKPLRWRFNGALAAPVVMRSGPGMELIYEARDNTTFRAPQGAPDRFNRGDEAVLTDFQSWAEVSALFAPLFDKAATISASSPLNAEVEKIRAASSDPKIQAAAALALVQDQVRYFLIAMGEGGLVPASAEETWTRRFGDCKGKTALLLALLRKLGIDAQPALISTSRGDGLDADLPTVGAFDHVMVRATIGGRVYWLDGTQAGGGSIDWIRTPPFHWALPVQAAGAALVPLTQTALTVPDLQYTLRMDARAGLEAPAPSHAEAIIRGPAAAIFHVGLANFTAEDQKQALRKYWSNLYDDIEPQTVSSSYDELKGEVHLLMDGQARLNWDGGTHRLDGVSMAALQDFKRDLDNKSDAPFELPFPFYTSVTETLLLPNNGAGYTFEGTDVARTVANIEYTRRVTMENGAVRGTLTARTLTPEVSAADASTSETTFKVLSRQYVYVVAPKAGAAAPRETSNAPGAPVRDTAPGGKDDPLIAQTLDFVRGEKYAEALSIMDQAAKAHPEVAPYHANKGNILAVLNRKPEAIAEYNAALALTPSAETYMARARLREKADIVARDADIDAAVKLDPASIRITRLRVALYRDAGENARAIETLNPAIIANPNSVDLLLDRADARLKMGATDQALADFATVRTKAVGDAYGLNALCWAAATRGVALEAALADCNASIAANPKYAPAIDSRAFVELRLNLLDAALADYNAALALRPTQGSSLYGRGLVKLRKGLKAEGDQDLAAARVSVPKIDDAYKSYGVTP